ncbi:MAG: hypothetical protein GWN01_15390 [Nitrosopumilaceae archaeon]|nr:hypothetical protein [Nitrosopumilaceae archaeon]NIU02226.1 hypothetical protein [Nitrosopumilaceae archaeon]NIU88684.1 hypothetical protein [Nitrosopumilaceae archaeon]NIV66843.1 hypothetical protein [Nitrosopumilaceae archaeon]NIX62827.1 hypothetical protein [Nitrosopumilaceae archaeon]
MYKSESFDITSWNQKCETILKEPEIRFAGIVDSMGNLIAGRFKEGVMALEDQADRRKMFMELILRVSTRQEFDHSLGEVEYSASRRKKAVMMSFPIKGKVLFISAETYVDIEKTAKKIKKLAEIP